MENIVAEFLSFVRQRAMPEQFVSAYEQIARQFLAAFPQVPPEHFGPEEVDAFLKRAAQRGANEQQLKNARTAADALVWYLKHRTRPSLQPPPAAPTTRTEERVSFIRDVEVTDLGACRSSDLSRAWHLRGDAGDAERRRRARASLSPRARRPADHGPRSRRLLTPDGRRALLPPGPARGSGARRSLHGHGARRGLRLAAAGRRGHSRGHVEVDGLGPSRLACHTLRAALVRPRCAGEGQELRVVGGAEAAGGRQRVVDPRRRARRLRRLGVLRQRRRLRLGRRGLLRGALRRTPRARASTSATTARCCNATSPTTRRSRCARRSR